MNTIKYINLLNTIHSCWHHYNATGRLGNRKDIHQTVAGSQFRPSNLLKNARHTLTLNDAWMITASSKVC